MDGNGKIKMKKDILKKNIEEKMKSYIFLILDEVEKNYDKKCLDLEYLSDYLLLACISLEIHYKTAKWEEIGYVLSYNIKEIVEEYKIHKYNTGMIGGYGYACFCVNYYSRLTGHLKRFSKSMHNLLLDEISKNIASYTDDIKTNKSNNFDCISGTAGNLYYLLDVDNIDLKRKNEVINQMVNYLIWLTNTHSYHGKEVFNFHIASENQFLGSEKIAFPNGNFNFGMSHGLISPLVALSKAYAVGQRNEGLVDAINILSNVYKKFKIKKNNSVYWPAQLSFESFYSGVVNEEEIHYASSWCYGNTGVLCGLILSSKYTNDEDSEQQYKNELICALNRPIEQTYLVSPALCHGYTSVLAGKLLLLHEPEGKAFYKELNEHIEAIINLSNYSTKIAQEHPKEVTTEEGYLEGYIGDYSLLNGVTGIVAVFSEILYGIKEYRKLLLIG